MGNTYDLIVIGAGSGGIVAADFAAKLGVRVALVEKNKIGGDCTWTGCVPSKALLKVAKVAHHARTAAYYGLAVDMPKTDMAQVKCYVQRAMAEVYTRETPETLAQAGIEVTFGEARFVDAHTIQVGERHLSARRFIIATGAHPVVPSIAGLDQTAYLTYQQLFENDQLPERFIVVGAGPVGVEMAQAYQRLGAQVTLIGEALLPKEDGDVAAVLGQVFAAEGIQFVPGRASAVSQMAGEIRVIVDEQAYCGDMLLLAVGRRPHLAGLNLSQAGVQVSTQGIVVNGYLQTNVKHIYAIGDCVAGNHQFTHVAGWQGAQAVRNAFMPLKSRDGFTDIVPWTTFTDPEVARVGLTERQARVKYGATARATQWPLSQLDRAVCENDQQGFIKVVHTSHSRKWKRGFGWCEVRSV